MDSQSYRSGDHPWTPLGRALLAYHGGDADAVLRVRREDGVEESVPASIFFRGEAELEPWETEALSRCRGRVLDVGAGAGAHSLVLQRRGFEVVALEILPEAVRVLKERGVARVVRGSLEELAAGEGGGAFDTVLLLMNGSNLAGTPGGLSRLFADLEQIVAPGGRVLLDSTDLREDAPDGPDGPPDDDPVSRMPDGRYVGELHYQLEFEGRKGPPFPHLFVDPDLLAGSAEEAGWASTVVWRDGRGAFLSELSRADRRGGLSRLAPPGPTAPRP